MNACGCMNVSHVCNACMYLFTYVMYVCLYAFQCVCMHACMHVCMYVCNECVMDDLYACM